MNGQDIPREKQNGGSGIQQQAQPQQQQQQQRLAQSQQPSRNLSAILDENNTVVCYLEPLSK